MVPDDDVQLPDLQVIQRYSLAVRAATAPRADVIEALQSDLAWLTGGARRTAAASVRKPPASTAPERTTPDKRPAPVKKAAAVRSGPPVSKSAPTPKRAAAPAKKPAKKKAPAKRAGVRRA